MVAVATGARRGAWTKTHLTPPQRKEATTRVKAARHGFWKRGAEPRDRGIMKVRALGVDSVRIVEEAIKHVSEKSHPRSGRKNMPVRIFVPGAGDFVLPYELKKIFGNKIHIITQDLYNPLGGNEYLHWLRLKTVSPALSPNEKKAVQNMHDELYLVRHRAKESIGKTASGKLEHHIGLTEDLRLKHKVDLIFDILSPHSRSVSPKRIIEQYANILEPGGKAVIVTSSHESMRDPKNPKGNEVETAFVDALMHAKRNGLKLTENDTHSHITFILEKV